MFLSNLFPFSQIPILNLTLPLPLPMCITGREVLEDVLVLRIENSIDYYAEVAAVLKRSCFGLRLFTRAHTWIHTHTDRDALKHRHTNSMIQLTAPLFA